MIGLLYLWLKGVSGHSEFNDQQVINIDMDAYLFAMVFGLPLIVVILLIHQICRLVIAKN